MKRIKLIFGAGLAFMACACLYCPVFHAMPKFMDRYDTDPLAKADLKGKCSVCHVEEDGFVPAQHFRQSICGERLSLH